MVYNTPNWIIAITVVGTYLVVTFPGVPVILSLGLIILAALICWFAFTRLYFSINYNKKIDVYLTNNLEGGGDMYVQDVLNYVREHIGPVESVFEYCAGPGFIGYYLLAHGMCEKLSLSDMSPKAVQAMQITVEENGLQDSVNVYQSDCLESIPATERWDLAVSNPPWWLTNKKIARWSQILCDPDGRVHRNFFRDVGKFLKPNGSILFIEGGRFTKLEDFTDMLEEYGYAVVDSRSVCSYSTLFKSMGDNIGLRRAVYLVLMRWSIISRRSYFIWAKRKEEVPGHAV